MTASARELLAAFEALPAAEQHQVAAEILRRSFGTGDLPEESLHELAAEVFRGYDAEEAAGASD
jgi:hypothetical protein